MPMSSFIDPQKKITVDHAKMETGADWNPYQGWSLAGFAEQTFCRGKQIVEDYQFVGENGLGPVAAAREGGIITGS